MNAVFVTDSVQVDYLREHFPDCVLLPLSAQAYAAALRWRPQDVVSFFEFVDFAECQQQYNQVALHLSKTWLKDLGLKFKVEGIDLAELDSACQFQFFTHCTYIEQTARELVAAHREIETFHVVSCKTPLPQEFYFESDVASAVLQFVCQELGRPVKVIEMQKRARFVQPQFEHRPIRLSSAPPSPFLAKKRVGIASATISTPQAILDQLDGSELVVFPSAWGRLPAPHPGVTYELSSAPGPWSAGITKDLTKLRIKISEAAKRSSLASSIIRNPAMSFQWDFIIQQRWPRYANMIHHAKALVKAMPLDLLILSEHFTAEGAILSRLYRQRGTQILIAPHSTWPCGPNWAIAERTDSAFTVVKSAAAKLRGSYGISKAVSIGKPSVTSYRSLFHPPPIRNAVQERRRLAGDRKIIVLVTNALEVDSFPLTDLGKYFETISVLAQVPETMKDRVLVAIKTKGGPLGEDPVLYSSLSGFTAETLTFLDGLTFAECIELADCAVGLNIPTGGYFEILEKGVPLIHYQSAGLTTLQPDLPTSVIPRIHEPSDIWPAIESLLLNPQPLIEKQQAFIREDRTPDRSLASLVGSKPPTTQPFPLRIEALERCADGARGNLDDILLGNNETAIAVGWAVDLGAHKPAKGIHIFLDSPRIAEGNPAEPRPDVATVFGDPAFHLAGFSVQFPLTGPIDLKRVRFFAELHDGRFFELPRPTGISY